MARTLKSTGIATSLKFLLAVEDNNTVRVFKSFNSSGVENTSSVNTDKTIHANVTVSSLTWNGHANTPIFYDSVNNNDKWVAFGTNKPYIIPGGAASGPTATYVMIGHTPNSTFGSTTAWGGDTTVPAMRVFISGGNYCSLERGDGIVLANSASNAYTANNDETWAAFYDSVSNNSCRFYRGVAGSSLGSANVTSSPGNFQYGEMGWVGGDGAGSLNWDGQGGGKLIMLAVFTGEISSTDLNTLHGDPYGTLFTGGAGGGGAVSKGLMTLGIG